MNDAGNRPEPPEASDDEATPSQPEPTPAPSPAAPLPGAAPTPEPDYTAAGVPTLDYVRDRIESRYATSLGATELAEESAKGREIEEQLAERDEAAKDRLEQIRKSLHPGTTE